MNEKVHVAGVGMIPFVKSGTGASYVDMGATAIGAYSPTPGYVTKRSH